MDLATDGADGERLRLLDMQAAPFEDGFVLRRGLVRLFVEAPGIEALLDALVMLGQTPQGATRAELLDSVEEGERPLMAELIEALHQRRFLVAVAEAEDPGAAGPHEQVFYWSYATSATAVRHRLGERRVAVIGVNHVGAVLAAALREMGFGEVTAVDHPLLRNLSLAAARGEDVTPFDSWAEADDLPDCIVLAADFGGPELARDWNAFCVEHGVTFYPVMLVDHTVMLGPLVLPGRSACVECALLRERSASSAITRHRASDTGAYFTQTSFGFLTPLADIVANLAATELLKFYSEALPGDTAGRMIEGDLMTPELTTRRILKVPRCPVCSPIRHEPTVATDVAVFMPGND